MANCTVTLNANVTAVAGRLRYEALPGQLVDGVAVDTTPVSATVATTVYTASLVQGARYRVLSNYFTFLNPIFSVPVSASADLADLIDPIT